MEAVSSAEAGSDPATWHAGGLKPITWFAPIVGVWLRYGFLRLPLSDGWGAVLGVVLAALRCAAPARQRMTGSTATWMRSNEPNRPIPWGGCRGAAGFISRSAGRWCRCWCRPHWDAWGFGAAVVGLALAVGYSAPPLRLEAEETGGQCRLWRLLRRLAVDHRRGGDGGLGPIGDYDDGSALQPRRARHHEAQRLQVGRGRPAHRCRFAAGSSRRGAAARLPAP